MDVVQILESDFFHHYQPIYDIKQWKQIGFEGLFRTEKQHDPETTFNLAKMQNMLYELDSTSAHKALLSYINAGYGSRQLFINVFPSTISNPLFLPSIKQLICEGEMASRNIVFEINENELIDFDCLKQGVNNFKKLGFQIAIDDLGSGFSTIKTILELNPDYIKLDKYYIQELQTSERKKYFIDFLLQYCEKYSSHLIVEGVEDNVTLAILKTMGIQYAQGYLLGRPALLTE